MLEMLEAAQILHAATPHSLVLMDEIGRGTSTFDGLALAGGIAAYLHNKAQAFTLFATHYFELTEFPARHHGALNVHVSAGESGPDIVFLPPLRPAPPRKPRALPVATPAGGVLYPSLRRITAAAEAFPKVPKNNEMHIVNPPKSAALAYPISTYTYVIVPVQTSHAAELRKLIFWALTQGQQPQYASKLLFAPLTKPVLVASEKTLKTIHS